MVHRLKTLGLASLAVLAMGAFVASAAQARFTANTYPTTFTAASPLGNDVFTVDGSSVNCKSHFEGALGAAGTLVTVKPTYTDCTGVFGFASGTVTTTGCDYLLKSSGHVSVTCESGTAIIITAANCEVQISNQSNLASIGLSNNGAHIDVDANVSGITANVTKDGFLCPLNGTGHKSATYIQEEPVTIEPISGGTSISVD